MRVWISRLVSFVHGVLDGDSRRSYGAPIQVLYAPFKTVLWRKGTVLSGRGAVLRRC